MLITCESSLPLRVRVGNTANFGIDPIPSNYRASIADSDTDTDTDL